MATERLLADVLMDLSAGRKTGALYVSAVEVSEDLVRIYFDKGELFDLRYGSAIGNDCLDILEFYNFHSATFFEGIAPPSREPQNLPKTDAIIAKIRSLDKKVKVR